MTWKRLPLYIVAAPFVLARLALDAFVNAAVDLAEAVDSYLQRSRERG